MVSNLKKIRDEKEITGNKENHTKTNTSDLRIPKRYSKACE